MWPNHPSSWTDASGAAALGFEEGRYRRGEACGGPAARRRARRRPPAVPCSSSSAAAASSKLPSTSGVEPGAGHAMDPRSPRGGIARAAAPRKLRCSWAASARRRPRPARARHSGAVQAAPVRRAPPAAGDARPKRLDLMHRPQTLAPPREARGRGVASAAAVACRRAARSCSPRSSHRSSPGISPSSLDRAVAADLVAP